jgi:hypothetical protein
LQPNAARPLQRRKEKTLPAEEHRFDISGALNVIINGRLEGDNAPGIHAQHFAGGKIPLQESAAGVNESPAIALQTLHDEPFSAEQTDAQPLLEGNADADTFGRAKKGILLRKELATDFLQMNRDDLARIRRTERDLLFAVALILKDGHEERFTGQQTFARTHQRAKKAALLLRSVAKDRLHLDAIFHVHHTPGLGDRRFLRVQLNLDELHVVAVNRVVHFVHRSHKSSFLVIVSSCFSRNQIEKSQPDVNGQSFTFRLANPGIPLQVPVMQSHEVLREVIQKGNAKEIAAAMGLSLSLIYKWAEPAEVGSGAANPLDRVEALVRCTNNPQLVQWLCERAGGFFIKNPSANWPHPYFLIPATNRIVQEFADLLAVIAAAAGDNSISKPEAKDIRGRWEELKSVTEGFVRCCEEGNFTPLKKDLGLPPKS